MPVHAITAKSILRKHKKIDSWFVSRYGMNLYRGCTHACAYCDGRAEGYYVDGVFGEDVYVKTNAVEVLARELDPARKRIPLKKCFFFIGGGVSDSYQPMESDYGITRRVLDLFTKYDHPVHILTKSTLVQRDMDLIERINDNCQAIVSFSLSSSNDEISHVFEPGVPPPSARLKTLARFKRAGIACGVYLLPIIPFATDHPKILDQTLSDIKKSGADFVVFGGMTLKDGRQKDHFLKVIEEYSPEKTESYLALYGQHDRWGQASGDYYHSLHQAFVTLVKKHRIPLRLPLHLYQNLLDENDLVVVMLEQLDYLLKLRGRKTTPLGYAAYSISKLKEPLSTMRNKLRTIKGVGPETARIIKEILDTKNCRYYRQLICG